MAGQLALTMDATASSAEDKYILSKMPELDYFESQIKKSAPEIAYSTELEVSGARYGPLETFIARIPTMGRFLRRIWVDIYINAVLLFDPIQQEQATPQSALDIDLLRLIAYRLIRSVHLVLSHKVIETLDSDWLCIWAELTLPQGQKEAWMTMASGMSVWDIDTDAQQLVLSIPIPFFFDDRDQYLPMFLLNPKDVDAHRLEITWAEIDPVLGEQISPGIIVQARAYAEYSQVALEQKHLAEGCSLERPIALVNSVTYSIPANASTVTFDLTPLGITLYRAIGALYFVINIDEYEYRYIPRKIIRYGEEELDPNFFFDAGYQFSFAGGYGLGDYTYDFLGPSLTTIYKQSTPEEVEQFYQALISYGRDTMPMYNRAISARLYVQNHKNQPVLSTTPIWGSIMCDHFVRECHESRATIRGLKNIHMIPFDFNVEESAQFAQYVTLPNLSLELTVKPIELSRQVRVFMRYSEVLTFYNGECSRQE